MRSAIPVRLRCIRRHSPDERCPAARSDQGLAGEVVYLNRGWSARDERPGTTHPTTYSRTWCFAEAARWRSAPPDGPSRPTHTLDTLLILLGQDERTWHGLAMSESETNIHPYTLEVIPPKEEGGNYNWSIRKHGKLAQRSDRGYPTATKAKAAGMATVEKLLSGSDR